MTLFKIASRVSQAILRISAQQIAVTALPIALMTTSPKAAEAASFSNLYVFGDSLSDVGNTLNATKIFPATPFYTPGRFSNGPVWVEGLASKLGKTVTTENNFAFGGARTGSDNGLNPLFPGLQQQVGSFTAKNTQADGDALYILWAGANDYLNDQLNFAADGVAGTTIGNAVTNLSTAITDLAKVGAKNFLIPNLPDLGKIPQFNKNPNPLIPSGLSAITQGHNTALSLALQSLSANPNLGLNLISLDVFSLVNQAINNPASLGYTNVTDPCLNAQPPLFSGDCGTPDQYLFWDNLHPTAKGHQQIGDLAYSVLQSKAPGKSVPESSTVAGVLVIGAFLGSRSLRVTRKGSLRRKAVSKKPAKAPVGVE
ncbi:SGNH/GDSL hydrolase family protein [Phormidesmis sp. 146-12]